ncbi:hypothetical protein ACH4TQ_44455 [Streptomyces sp. NPDC021218]|uniref:hypothetical protein n=1 Tax=Streptomyces sp. NPDC021218 TaxID=3365119 RepID=UPI0037A59270
MRAVAGTAVAFAMLGSLPTGAAQAADQKREIKVTIDPVAKAAASGDDAALCTSTVPRTEVWARTHSCQTVNATVNVLLNGRPVGMAKFTVQHTMDLDIESTKFAEEVKIGKARLSGEARGITASFGASCGSGCSAKDNISPFVLGSSAKTGKIDYSNPVGQGKREKRTTGYRFSLVKPGYSPGSVAYNSPF